MVGARPAGFWHSIWDYFDLQSPTPPRPCWPSARCPARSGFPARRSTMRSRCSGMSTAAHAAGLPAIVSARRGRRADGDELAGAAAQGRGAGAAPEGTRASAAATASRPTCRTCPRPSSRSSRRASIGGVWSVCAPDMGAPAVLDRFRQIEPKVLIACDGVTYAGRRHDRTRRRRRAAGGAADASSMSSCTATAARATHRMPLLVRRSSPGTRRRDRRVRAGVAAVRSSAVDRLFQRHHRPAQADRARPWRHRASWRWRCWRCTTTSAAATTQNSFGERFHWYSSTGWIMWNCAGRRRCSTARPAASSTATPAAPKDKPDWTTLWRFVARTESDLLRRRRGVLRQLHEGRDRSRALPATCRGCARSARPARRSAPTCKPGSTRASRRSRRPTAARRRPTSGGQHLRRHRFRRRLHRRQPRAAADAGRDAVPPARLRGRSLERAGPAPSSTRSASSSAPSRCRRCRCTSGTTRATRATVASYFDTYPDNFDGSGRGPSGATATGSRSPRTAAASSTAAATPPSTAMACAWARASSTRGRGAARGARFAWWSTSNISAAKATCRCSWCCATASRSTTRCRRRINKAIEAGLSPRFVPERDLCGRRDPAHALRQEAGAADQEAAARPAGREGRQQGRDGQSRLPRLVSRFREDAIWRRREAETSPPLTASSPAAPQARRPGRIRRD